MISSIKIATPRIPNRVNRPSTPTLTWKTCRVPFAVFLGPEGFANHGDKIQADAVVLAKGKVDRRGGGDEANLIIDELTLFEELEGRYTHGLRIMLDEKEHGPETVHGLREICAVILANRI